MTDRIIDISDISAFLKIENKLLVIVPKQGEKVTIPLVEIGVLLLSNKCITLTHPVLARISEAGGTVIVTNEKHLPVGIMQPLQGNFVQSERINIQANATLPVKKQIWKQLVIAKITNQGKLLLKVNKNDAGLLELASNVRSGDPDNVEARAAAIYWKHLKIISKRDRFANDANRFLNYGYAVLMAACARAITASGLHPALGVHHHNKYNNFCLASDIMEPFRPLIDLAVLNILTEFDKNAEINKHIRQHLISSILGNVYLESEKVSLFYALTRLCSSMLSCLSKHSNHLIIPENIFTK